MEELNKKYGREMMDEIVFVENSFPSYPYYSRVNCVKDNLLEAGFKVDKETVEEALQDYYKL